MSLRRFLNVAYNILIEEYQRMGTTGMDLLSALEKVAEFAEGATKQATETPSRAVASQNEQAMAALKARMAGVKGSPV